MFLETSSGFFSCIALFLRASVPKWHQIVKTFRCCTFPIHVFTPFISAAFKIKHLYNWVLCNSCKSQRDANFIHHPDTQSPSFFPCKIHNKAVLI